MPSLPGQYVSLNDDEWGLMCYTHHDRPATRRICVESDSFGSEYYNMCDECNEEHIANKAAIDADPERWETCKCGNREPRMIQYRDMDEGMHGPVYEHCSKCHEKWNQRIAEEEEYYRQDDDWYDDEPYYDPRDDDIPERDAGSELLESFAQVLGESGIKGFDVKGNHLYLENLEPRKFKRLKSKLLKWFERYTDAYSHPQEGLIGSRIADRWGYGHDQLYTQFETKKVDRYSLASKPSLFVLRNVSKTKRKNIIKYGPFVKPKHSIIVYLTIYG